MWVRLVGIYLDVNRTAKVDGAGAFMIDKVPTGRYMIMVFANGVLKDSRSIDVRIWTNRITIE